MISIQENCINKSRKKTIKICDFKTNIRELNKRMLEKNLLANECIYISKVFHGTSSSNSLKILKDNSQILDTFCTTYNNLTFIKQKNFNISSCWKELDYFNKKCIDLYKCCSLQYNCIVNERNIDITKKINQIKDKLFNDIKKCKEYMIIEFEKLFNNSRHDLLKNFYKTNHYNLFDIRNDQLYSNIENLELFEKYYFVYKILSQKKFDKDKKDTFFEKLNNSQQNIEIINKNKLIFKKLSTTTYVPVYKILNNLKIEKLNQTTIKDKSIFKKIYLPERYNSNEIKKSLIPKKENESNYLEKNFKNLQDNDSSISGNLEPMSKDYHIVNISKINQNPLHKNNTIYKVIQNILNILLQTNDKSNGNSVDGIVKNVNS